jgi:chemotaxis response regulator CheB
VSYLVDDGKSSVAFVADTGGGRVLASLPASPSPLRAVFIEASFPNRMKDFAVMTGHLTPAMLAAECEALPAGVPVIVTHMKPGFETELVQEVGDLQRAGVRCCRDGDVFDF